MKGIILKLTMAASSLALLAGVTYGAFNSNTATITGVVLGSSTPTLQVYTGTEYADTASGAALGITESGMYPGWSGADHTFWLKNTSADTAFGQVVANLPSAINNWTELKDVVLMQFGETGTGWSTPWYTLNEWNAGSANILLSQLPANTERQFSIHFKMDSGATDAAKGKTLTLDLSFIGQTP